MFKQELLLSLLQNMEQKKIKVSKCKIESSRNLRIFSWQTFFSLLVMRLLILTVFLLLFVKLKKNNLLFFIVHKLFFSFSEMRLWLLTVFPLLLAPCLAVSQLTGGTSSVLIRLDLIGSHYSFQDCSNHHHQDCVHHRVLI